MNPKDFRFNQHRRNTPQQEQLITLFFDNEGLSFSESEINQIFNNALTPEEIHRAICLLVKKTTLRKVICENGVLKYVHKKPTPPPMVHPYFQCTQCGKVVCLNEKGITKAKLPQGLTKENSPPIIQGICARCAAAGKKNT